MHGTLNVKFEQRLLCETKKEEAHSVSDSGSSSTIRWITVQYCYNTLAEPSKFPSNVQVTLPVYGPNSITLRYYCCHRGLGFFFFL